MRTLRDDQAEPIRAVRDTYAAGIRRMVLSAPTGWGKTIVAADVIRHNVERGKRTTFLVDSIDLLDQTVQRFFEEGIYDVGVIQANHEMENRHRLVQVASVRTLERRRIIPDCDLVINDECHVRYKFVSEWMKALPPHVLFVGLSATPFTKGLGDDYETMIPTLTTNEAIAKGILVPPQMFSCSHPSLSSKLKDVKEAAGDYQQNQLSAVMNDKELTGDVVRTWLDRWGRDKGKTLMFGVDRIHAQSLYRRLQSEGVRAAYQDGTTPRESGPTPYSNGEWEMGRREIKEKFHTGEFEIVVSIGTMTKGTDWDVWCISDARPTKSATMAKQKMGRGLRTAPGKTHCVYLDHGNVIGELGWVVDIECDALHKTMMPGGANNHVRKPSITYAKVCPKCQCVKAPGAGVQACQECGFQPTLTTPWVETNDVLDEVDRRTLPKGRKREFTMEDKIQFMGELKSYARSKGFSAGWAANKYREKFGVWPNDPRVKHAISMEPSVVTLSWIRAGQIRWAKSKSNPNNHPAQTESSPT